jgi:hypothetical protein
MVRASQGFNTARMAVLLVTAALLSGCIGAGRDSRRTTGSRSNPDRLLCFVYVTPGMPGAGQVRESRLVTAVWQDGLVVFAPDSAEPTRYRTGQLEPSEVESLRAALASSGWMGLASETRYPPDGTATHVAVWHEGVRRLSAWDEWDQMRVPGDEFPSVWWATRGLIVAAKPPVSEPLEASPRARQRFERAFGRDARALR